MILKASQRGGGRQLAAHLLRTDENEHVEVHELRGFIADDLHGAFQETYAPSKGTRARQPFFSLSLNPPMDENVPTEVFEDAIERVEKRLGLINQPRAIVFHEKDGRRHAHAVWSRIDTETMKAINLPHYKLKLRDIARDIYLERGWQMPRGFINSKERDPFNFTLAEWQQAKRAKDDPKALKQMFRECWAISDSGKAFAQALKSRGYTLARGDRRGYVAVDFRGEAYAIARYAGVKAKQVRERLGDVGELPSVAQAKDEIARRMSEMLKIHIENAQRKQKLRSASLRFQYEQTVQRQRDEREKLRQMQEKRWSAETAARAARISKGFRGLWDRLTGRHAEIKRQNEREALLAFYRDRQEKDDLIFRQIEERKRLHERIREERDRHALDIKELRCGMDRYAAMRTGGEAERFRKAVKERGPRRDRGPER